MAIPKKKDIFLILSDFPTIFVRKSYVMVNISDVIIEKAIIDEVSKLKGLSTVDAKAEIDKNCKPGVIGVRSQILVDVMGILEEVLHITIPNNCYIFRENKNELSIKEAAAKLKNKASYAK